MHACTTAVAWHAWIMHVHMHIVLNCCNFVLHRTMQAARATFLEPEHMDRFTFHNVGLSNATRNFSLGYVAPLSHLLELTGHQERQHIALLKVRRAPCAPHGFAGLPCGAHMRGPLSAPACTRLRV